MSEWLKRDPEDGWLIGPDGCHYKNEHQAAYYGLLKLCGCGSPDIYNFCRDALTCFNNRCDDKPLMRVLKELIQARPNDAAYALAHLLTHLGLLEHGDDVGDSWLTNNGERIVDMGPMTEDLLDGNS